MAVVRNNYLNNWAFKEKTDCLKAVFCGKSIRGNHFFWLPDVVFFINFCSQKMHDSLSYRFIFFFFFLQLCP